MTTMRCQTYFFDSDLYFPTDLKGISTLTKNNNEKKYYLNI